MVDDEKNMTFWGIIIAIISYLTFSAGDAFVKHLGATYHSTQIVFFSHLFACVPIMFYLALSKSQMGLFPKRPKWVMLRCVAAAISAPVMFYAFTHMPMTEVYVIIFATPALITLLAIPMLGEQIGVYRSFALIFGFTGVIIVLNPTSLSDLSTGHMAALLGIFCGSISAVIMRKVRNDENPLTMSVYPVLSVMLSGLFLMIPHYKPVPLLDLGLMALAGMFFVSAGFLLILAYKYTEASIIAPLQYSQMIWALLFSAYIFNEETPETVYYGLPFILLSGALILYRESKLSSSKETVTETRWRTNMLVPLLRNKQKIANKEIDK